MLESTLHDRSMMASIIEYLCQGIRIIFKKPTRWCNFPHNTSTRASSKKHVDSQREPWPKRRRTWFGKGWIARKWTSALASWRGIHGCFRGMTSYVPWNTGTLGHWRDRFIGKTPGRRAGATGCGSCGRSKWCAALIAAGPSSSAVALATAGPPCQQSPSRLGYPPTTKKPGLVSADTAPLQPEAVFASLCWHPVVAIDLSLPLPSLLFFDYYYYYSYPPRSPPKWNLESPPLLPPQIHYCRKTILYLPQPLPSSIATASNHISKTPSPPVYQEANTSCVSITNHLLPLTSLPLPR